MSEVISLSGKLKLKQLLSEHSGQYKDVNATNKKGQTALMIAVMEEDSATIELLLANGASPNLRDHDGYTAVMHLLAAGFYRHSTLELLCSYGAYATDLDLSKVNVPLQSDQ